MALSFICLVQTCLLILIVQQHVMQVECQDGTATTPAPGMATPPPGTPTPAPTPFTWPWTYYKAECTNVKGCSGGSECFCGGYNAAFCKYLCRTNTANGNKLVASYCDDQNCTCHCDYQNTTKDGKTCNTV